MVLRAIVLLSNHLLIKSAPGDGIQIARLSKQFGLLSGSTKEHILTTDNMYPTEKQCDH